MVGAEDSDGSSDGLDDGESDGASDGLDDSDGWDDGTSDGADDSDGSSDGAGETVGVWARTKNGPPGRTTDTATAAARTAGAWRANLMAGLAPV